MGKIIKFSFLILLLNFFIIPECFALGGYNGYGGYSVGDTRIIGMGGAYIGVSDDINGILYNPAGLVYSKRAVDLKLTQNRIDNSQTDLTGDGKKDGFPLRYWYAGVVGRIMNPSGNHNLALGVAYTIPYRAVVDFEDNVTVSGFTFPVDLLLDLGVTSYSFPLAIQVLPRLSLGATLNLYTVEEIFQCKYLNVNYDYSQKVSKTSADLGMMYWLNNRLTVGLIFKSPVIFNFDETMNQKLDNGAVQWFRDVKLPLRAGAGFSYRLSDKMSINTDVNYIQGQKNSELIGSKLIFNFKEYKMKEKDVVDFHIGGNYYWQINNWLKLDFRGGGYFEPSRVEGLNDRIHLTGGVQLYLWRVYTGLGYDTASDFENLSVIFGVIF